MRKPISLTLLTALVLLAHPGIAQKATVPSKPVPGVPGIIAQSKPIARLNAAEKLNFTFTLPVRDQAGLDNFLAHLYKSGDPLYQKYLTPAQFTDKFGPTQANYEAVIAFARASGLTVKHTHSNRLLLDVEANTATVEKVFQTEIHTYQAPTGRRFHAPKIAPRVPQELAAHISGVTGLDNAYLFHPLHAKKQSYLGGFTPGDIKTAYNLNGLSVNGTTLDGTGQTLALFELDGYTASDITAYENQFGLPHTPLENVLVDGFNGNPTSYGAGEVTLDIELMAAVAPKVTKIIVYEGPNFGNGFLDTYNQIATENRAKSVSCSWGAPEEYWAQSELTAMNNILQQMAAQGQSNYAASGDSGAYDNAAQDNGPYGFTGGTLSIDMPASAPYMTGVGGTWLTTNGAGGSYKSERAWFNGSHPADFNGGGGGSSSVWLLPSYQQGVVSGAALSSTTWRNVPDVSLNAASNSYYVIYYNGWKGYYGTSCAAPLWAAFTALVNQARTTKSLSSLGFANPTLYAIGQGANYNNDFHDIKDNSTNGYYPAVTGYDLATGWGSFNGANLLMELYSVGYSQFYVDSAYTGSLEAGTQVNPYKSLTNAMGHVTPNVPTIIHIRAHSATTDPLYPYPYPEGTGHPGTPLLLGHSFKSVLLERWAPVGTTVLGKAP